MTIFNIHSFLKKHESDIALWLLCAIAITIPFKVNYGNLSIILASVFTLVTFKQKTFKKLLRPAYLFPIVFFLITILSSVYSKNTQGGFKRTDLELLPVLFVLIIANQHITKAKVLKILNCFLYATLFFTFILMLVALFNRLNGINSGVFHDFTDFYDQHPVYYAMYISIALGYLLLYPVHSIFKNKKGFKVISLAILTCGLVLCASKAVIFIDLVLAFFILFFSKNTLKSRLSYVFMLIVVAVVFSKVNFIKDRFEDGLRFSEEILDYKPTNDFREKKHFNYDEKENISDLELRYLFFKTMFFHILEDDKVLFGYGQGDVQDYIDYYYYSYNLAPNWYEGFNVHNQYLHVFITYGVFTLILFLAYILYSFASAIKHKDLIVLIFLIISSFVFIFEVLLVRNKGIIFFYFFNTLFLANFLNFEDSNLRNKGNTKLSWWV